MIDPKEWLSNISAGLRYDATTMQMRIGTIAHRAEEVDKVLVHVEWLEAEVARLTEERDGMVDGLILILSACGRTGLIHNPPAWDDKVVEVVVKHIDALAAMREAAESKVDVEATDRAWKIWQERGHGFESFIGCIKAYLEDAAPPASDAVEITNEMVERGARTGFENRTLKKWERASELERMNWRSKTKDILRAALAQEQTP